MNTTFNDSDCLSSFLKIDKAEFELKKYYRNLIQTE